MRLSNINIDNIKTGKKHNYTKKTIMEDYDAYTNSEYIRKIHKAFEQHIKHIDSAETPQQKLLFIYAFAFDENLDKYTTGEYNYFSEETKEFLLNKASILDTIDNDCLEYVENNFLDITGHTPVYMGFEDDLDMVNYISEHYPTIYIIEHVLPNNVINDIIESILPKIQHFYDRMYDIENKKEADINDDDGEIYNEAFNPSNEKRDEREFFEKLSSDMKKVDLYRWLSDAVDLDNYLGRVYTCILNTYIPGKYINYRPELYEEINKHCEEAMDHVNNIVIQGAYEKLREDYYDQGEPYILPNGEEYYFNDEDDILYFIKWRCTWTQIFSIYTHEKTYTLLTTSLLDIKTLVKKYKENHKDDDANDVNDDDGEIYTESKQLNEDRCTQLTEKGKYKVGDVLVNRSSNSVEPETITKIEDCYTNSGIYLGTLFELQWEKENATYIWRLDEKTLDERYIPYEIFINSNDDSNDGENWDEEI